MSSSHESPRKSVPDATPAPHQIGQRYRMLQRYIQWSDGDRRNVMRLGAMLRSSLEPLVEDFFTAVLSHPMASRFVTGGAAQVDRLKVTLRQWLQLLFAGNYDESYAVSRWNVGRRHVEIGLDQVLTYAAMSRLRTGILDAIGGLGLSLEDTFALTRSLSRLLDLELAIIEDAYQQEYIARQEPVHEARLRQQERLAGIGQMMTGIAHESRNALQRIQACTEMLEMEVPPESEAMYLVARIERAQDDLNRMFNEVRSYASAIRLELALGDVSTVWHEAWEQIEGERRQRDAQLQARRCVRPVEIRMDRYRLVQVFRNLFENALSAGTDPVRIEVCCRRVRFNQEHGVEIVVRDNGPGFDEVSRCRAFDPFFTTKTKGTGLGLAIAQRIVEAHRGSIAIAPTRGAGAEFIIRLPVSS